MRRNGPERGLPGSEREMSLEQWYGEGVDQMRV